MTVEIRLKETSQGIVFQNAANAYQKGDMYCVYLKDEGEVHKYPISAIFSIKESYL